MTERPIIFNGPMVRAVLGGRKTQTRRVVKLPDRDVRNVRYWAPPSGRSQEGWADPGVNYHSYGDRGELVGNHIDPCPWGQPGDRLWVRETWATHWMFDDVPPARITRYLRPEETRPDCLYYQADDPLPEDPPHKGRIGRWRRSIHMPRWASRLDLLVTGIGVERLQDISSDDAIAEGLQVFNEDGAVLWYSCSAPVEDWPTGWTDSPIEAYRRLWNALNAERGYQWVTNPWVWVIEFERIQGGQ